MWAKVSLDENVSQSTTNQCFLSQSSCLRTCIIASKVRLKNKVKHVVALKVSLTTCKHWYSL